MSEEETLVGVMRTGSVLCEAYRSRGLPLSMLLQHLILEGQNERDLVRITQVWESGV